MSTDKPFENDAQKVSLADEVGVKEILVGKVMALWDIVNNLTRIRPSGHERYRVTIFGSVAESYAELASSTAVFAKTVRSGRCSGTPA